MLNAMAENRTRVNCLEGNYANGDLGDLTGHLLVMCHGLFCSSNLVVFNQKNGYRSY